MDDQLADIENQTRFQALLATAVDGIVVIDASGVVQVYNAACERLFGYRAEEVIGRNVNMLMPDPYRENHDRYIEAYRKTGMRKIIGIGREVVGRRRDGSTFPMYLSVGEGRLGTESLFVGIIHDITERQATEQRMQELQAELLHVSRLNAMGQMASGLAHELNQPLTAIMNYIKAADRSLNTIDAGLAGHAHDLLDKAAAQTARAGQIIRRLRDFIEKRPPNYSPENLNRVIEESLVFSPVGSANIQIRLKLEQDLPLVSIDKVQIQQVMLNLIRNGVEAMERSDRRDLCISTDGKSPAHVRVCVSDTGAGLPQEMADKLFHPFVTTKKDGMGIGLSICLSIIEAHGGRLAAEPNPGGGAIFSFELPRGDRGAS